MHTASSFCSSAFLYAASRVFRVALLSFPVFVSLPTELFTYIFIRVGMASLCPGCVEGNCTLGVSGLAIVVCMVFDPVVFDPVVFTPVECAAVELTDSDSVSVSCSDEEVVLSVLVLPVVLWLSPLVVLVALSGVSVELSVMTVALPTIEVSSVPIGLESVSVSSDCLL